MYTAGASAGAVLLAAAGLTAAGQPGALAPVRAPMRDLVWGQLNFLHTTDTHGWHGGHLQETQYSADWGDYVSFATHMRARADAEGRDLLLVDTGDRVEGNGLYDGSNPVGKYYYDIYKEQDIDILCTGNHELYHATTADREHNRTVPNFEGRYIASNLDYIEPGTGKRVPMAPQRYKKFQTKNQKIDIVAFGFLFDFKGNDKNTVVQPIKETIQEQWFQDAIREKTDLFVVVGHVGVQMQEFKDIFAAIREVNWHTPIVFFGGHVHVRDATSYDAKSFAIASGRYFETIGWMSIDGIDQKAREVGTESVSFTRRYIDNNLLGMCHHSGKNRTTFPTDHGRKVTKMIAKARKALDLDYTYGCAPKDYWMTRVPITHENSIYTLLKNEILPNITVKEGRNDIPRLSIMNTGAIRFDIFKGAFTRDSTYIVSPFLSKLVYIKDVPYDVASKVLHLVNNGGPVLEASELDARLLAVPEQWHVKEPILYQKTAPAAALVFEDNAASGQKPLGGNKADEDKPELVSGYTTKDDIGNDGDDAEHSPLNFYTVPNCIQTEIAFPAEGDPNTVDVVFFDFIQPWVLMALKLSGGSYAVEDVEPYSDETFTELMEGWIKQHWPPNC